MKGVVRSLLIAFACLFASGQTFAQSKDPVAFARFMQKYQSYKTPFARFRFSINPHQLADSSVNFWAGQLAAADASIMGRPNDALFYFPIASPAAKSLPDPANYHAVDARDWIAAQAPRYRMVMINEAHHAPQTRLLTLSLLKPLHDSGFRYLALETLRNDGHNPVPAGYPVSDSGEYTQEPVMADLVREALRLGYTLVPYESDDRELRDIAGREASQAHNLQRFMAAHPDAKILLHAGYAHTAKADSVLISGAPTMATDLVKATKVRVLSIDQVKLTPLSFSSHEVIDTQERLAKEFKTTGPVVFINQSNDSAWAAEPGAYDASVLLPASPTQVIRPDWLALDGQRHKIYMDAKPCGFHFPCLIQAFYSGEPDQAIPADQIVMMVEADTNTPLFLREGYYRLRYVTEEDQKIIERQFIVKPPGNNH
ncbi:hypothetical protein [Solilutibacter silvestris]|uniref:Uncharacterized protein n=1 Tax=Solilutibacter silvestris TaxID=1645665 RepID=A0A2K1PYU2_9GAMM|nr:hypothetical protein [Lysobacter silvestris]PNS07939.1 hypothetical protein Lysil_2115 [Lysobacter silvestris]